MIYVFFAGYLLFLLLFLTTCTHHIPIGKNKENDLNYNWHSNLVFTNIIPQYFNVTKENDTIIGSKGTKILLRRSAFVTSNNDQVSGDFKVLLIEATTKKEILELGYPTKSGDTILESGGVFIIKVFKNFDTLKIRTGDSILVGFPNYSKQNMNVYTWSNVNSSWNVYLEDTNKITPLFSKENEMEYRIRKTKDSLLIVWKDLRKYYKSEKKYLSYIDDRAESFVRGCLFVSVPGAGDTTIANYIALKNLTPVNLDHPILKGSVGELTINFNKQLNIDSAFVYILYDNYVSFDMQRPAFLDSQIIIKKLATDIPSTILLLGRINGELFFYKKNYLLHKYYSFNIDSMKKISLFNPDELFEK